MLQKRVLLHHLHLQNLLSRASSIDHQSFGSWWKFCQKLPTCLLLCYCATSKGDLIKQLLSRLDCGFFGPQRRPRKDLFVTSTSKHLRTVKGEAIKLGVMRARLQTTTYCHDGFVMLNTEETFLNQRDKRHEQSC